VRRNQSRTAENREAVEFEPIWAHDHESEFKSWSGARDLNPGPRSRTVLVACPCVSRRLPRYPPELNLRLLGVRLCPPRAAWCRESVPRLCPGTCLKRMGPATTSHQELWSQENVRP
jgi:hypothetical protein